MINKILNFFEHICVVNLKERSDRRLRMHKELKYYEIPGATFFNAQRGENGKTKHMKGTIGRAITEYLILKKCIESNSRNVLIFEDDVELYPNFYSVLFPAIQELPNDWALFYLGVTPGRKDSMSYYSENLLKVQKCWGCFAICYSQLMMHYLVDFYEAFDILNTESLPLSIDGLCGTKLQNEFPCFCTNPPIVGVINDRSDISREKYRQRMKNYCIKQYNEVVKNNNGIKRLVLK